MTSCAGKKPENSTAKAPSKIDVFKSSADWAKLDLHFKQAWEKAMTAGETDKKLDCFIKTKAKMDKNEKGSLADAGYTLRSLTGRIGTGSVEADNVPRVAALPFIQAMELAVPVSPKK
jgi:hypothetical protein